MLKNFTLFQFDLTWINFVENQCIIKYWWLLKKQKTNQRKNNSEIPVQLCTMSLHERHAK